MVDSDDERRDVGVLKISVYLIAPAITIIVSMITVTLNFSDTLSSLKFRETEIYERQIKVIENLTKLEIRLNDIDYKGTRALSVVELEVKDIVSQISILKDQMKDINEIISMKIEETKPRQRK